MSKILNVVNIFFTIPYFFGEQLIYFTNKGYRIHLICSPSEKLRPYAQKHGCEDKEVVIEREFSVGKDWKAFWQLYRYIRRERFDIVCGHTPKAGMLAMAAAFFARTPKRVFFRHGLVYETATGFKRFVLMNAERLASLFATQVVCVSPYLIERSVADRLTRRRKMILFNRGSCNGVDVVERFNPDRIDQPKLHALRTRLQLPDDAFVVGYIGRLVRDKGIVELVEAFVRFDSEVASARLLLVGPMEERDSLPEEIVALIDTHPHIVYAGAVEEDQQYYYAMTDLFILCTHREGLSTSILEASSMRIPVLTTAHTGSRDAIVEGRTGEFVTTDAESVYQGIKRYYDDPALRRRHGEQGREFVVENFEQELIWRQIESKIYN